MGNPSLFANIARFAIIGFAVLIALEQLQIASTLINELFGGLITAAAIAIGLAFGLGGQETARKWLNCGESTVSTAASSRRNSRPPIASHRRNHSGCASFASLVEVFLATNEENLPL